MKRRARISSFRQQMRQSIADLNSIMEGRESPSGNGRFTVRNITVVAPSVYCASSVRSIRKTLSASQPVFAQLLGVSVALVRAWELGRRVPAPIARRLLDQMRDHPSEFVSLVRASRQNGKPSRSAA